jgi:NADP-dependent aldehyde dehydrogenase
MSEILGHNYIGGARSAAGSITLHSRDANTGEALPYSFMQATAEEVDAAAQAAAFAYPTFRNLPQRAGRISSTPSPRTGRAG